MEIREAIEIVVNEAEKGNEQAREIINDIRNTAANINKATE